VYVAERVPFITQLERNLRAAQVSVRGWDLPNLGAACTINRAATSISGSTDWNHHREAWHFYSSGQFKMLRGLPEDWRDRSVFWTAPEGWQHGRTLSIGSFVFDCLEYVEFARRATHSLMLEQSSLLSLEFVNFYGRTLVMSVPEWSPMFEVRTCEVRETLKRELVIQPGLNDAERDTAAMELAQYIFDRFNWAVDVPYLQKLLDYMRTSMGKH
jgi:hypothetical protein